MVKASEKLNRFMMMAGKHDAIAKKYGVSGYPTFIFIGPDGKKVGDASRNAEALIKQIDEIAEKYNRAPKWTATEEEAVKAAKEGELPLVVFYRDDKPKSALAEQEFSAQPLAELYDKAVWVQKTLDLKSDEAKSLGISALPAVWIIDARVDDAKARIVKKSAPKSATIKSDLASILKSWKKASTEAPKEEPKKE